MTHPHDCACRPTEARRHFLGQLGAGASALALRLSPLAAAVTAACGKDGHWPEGMVEIKWDRDVCDRCKMVISDRRFAAEMRGGPKDQAYKFDDIGCALFFIKEKAADFPWLNEAATRFWVADSQSSRENPRWLEARKAQYGGGARSPMGYNQSASALPVAGGLDFESTRTHLLAKGK